MAKKVSTGWTKIYNLFRQVTRRNNLTYDKYLPYFENDNFPLIWHEAISKSPSATACVSTIQDFLEGIDFSDPELSKKVVNNRGETFFQVHHKTCQDFGEFEGFAWLFRYNALGHITEWINLPFESVRLGKPDDNGYISQILYNPFFGTQDFKIGKDTKYYYTFNPSVVKQQILADGAAFCGQVFYFGTTTANSRFYPMPEATSALPWMKTESGVADYNESNTNNAFLQPFMLVMKGNPNDPANNPEDGSTDTVITKGQAFDEIVSNGFMGPKRVGNMWVHWVDNPEEAPTVIPMPTNNTGDQLLAVDTQAIKKITTAFKVMAILANISEGATLGGDGNAVRVAVKMQQQRVIKKQRILTDAYEKIWKLFSVPYVNPIAIAPYNPYPELEVIDQKIWDAMTADERRQWIEENTEIELFDEPATGSNQLPGAPPQARLVNLIPGSFPDTIRNSIKKALDFQDKMGMKCGGRGGREVAEQIVKNQNMPLRALKRIYSYLNKRPELENSGFSDCEALQYASWGGKEMEVFLEAKLKELDAWLN